MPVDTLRAPAPPTPRELRTPRFPSVRALAERELPTWGVVAVLVIFTLASLWLRTRALHFHYWIDEGLSVGIAGHPLSEIPSVLRQDGSPPLYYAILHVWMSVFGHGEAATHLLSLIFALLCIPVAFWLGASLFGRRAGLISAGLAAGAPYLTIYAQETRMYALLTLLALLVAGSFVEAFIRRRRRYLPVFTVSLAAALYTHNWALFLGLATAAAFLLVVRESDDRRALWRDGAIAFGGVAILYAPWLPTVAYQARHTGAPWDLPPVIWSLSQGGYSLVGGRGAAVALLFGAVAGLVAVWKLTDAQRWLVGAAKALLILGVGTVLIAWLYSKITPAWAPRYLAVIVGPLILLFGLGLARGGRLALAAVALTACFWVLDPVPTSLNTKENVASVASKVRAHLGTDPLVLATQPEQVPTIAYYLPQVKRFGTPMGPVADAHVVDWRDALNRLRRASVQGTLLPMVDALLPGQRVVLVNTINLPDSPPWMKLIKRDGNRWLKALNHDPAFKKVVSSSAGSNSAGVAVNMNVFVRR
jgi:mannosyltransferase